MSDDPDLPAGWTFYLPFITDFVRKLLSVLGGAGFTWALAVNASQVQMGVSAAMVLASFAWGQWQKLMAQRALQKAAAARAHTSPPNLPA